MNVSAFSDYLPFVIRLEYYEKLPPFDLGTLSTFEFSITNCVINVSHVNTFF